MSALDWIGVAVLGGAGAVLRVVIAALIAPRAHGSWPLGIFAVNVSGALALGLLVGSAASAATVTLLGGGLLGGYTTFSTWMLESVREGEERRRGVAAANVLLSLAAGLGAVALGRALG